MWLTGCQNQITNSPSAPFFCPPPPYFSLSPPSSLSFPLSLVIFSFISLRSYSPPSSCAAPVPVKGEALSCCSSVMTLLLLSQLHSAWHVARIRTNTITRDASHCLSSFSVMASDSVLRLGFLAAALLLSFLSRPENAVECRNACKRKQAAVTLQEQFKEQIMIAEPSKLQSGQRPSPPPPPNDHRDHNTSKKIS